MGEDSKELWLVYLVGSCEMGSEGESSILYPCVCYGDSDEEILQSYLKNIKYLYRNDFIEKNISYNKFGDVFSYYPIHKVYLPRSVYGRVQDYTITLTYEDHHEDPEDNSTTSSFSYEGEQISIERLGNLIMSEARKCDSSFYDLCPNCAELLDKWLENPDNYDPNDFIINLGDADCADRSNGATERELKLASELNDAKIYIAQLKAELGYTMTKEEIESMKDIHNFTDEDISEAAKFVETKSSKPDYIDPCKSCHNGICEQCDYGYISEEDKKKKWLERHKKEESGT